jgi:hypothetical protein
MKHATAASLAQLEPLLARVRSIAGLVERKPGTFYRRSAAFLHFHEDAAGLFADVKLNGVEFERMRVSTAPERDVFWRAVLKACSTPASATSPQGQPRGHRENAA